MKPLLITTFLLFVLQGCGSSATSYTLTLSEAELQKKVDAMLPIEKKKSLITVVIENPVINLLEASNEIGIMSDVKVKVPGNMAENGQISLKGTLRYDKAAQVFFFDNLNIISLDIAKVPQRFMPLITPVLERMAQEKLAQKPVFKFKDDKLKHQLAKATLQSVKVENGALLAELSLFQD